MITKKQFQEKLVEIRDSMINSDFPTNFREINNGYCADFATIVWRSFDCHPDVCIFNDEELGSVEYTHTFLKFQRIYYDAECVEGVKNWNQLPIFIR
jgi:hypothetical protein